MDIHDELNDIRRRAGLQEQARPMESYIDELIKLGVNIDVDGTGDEFQELLGEMGIIDWDTGEIDIQELRSIYETEARALERYYNMPQIPIWRAVQVPNINIIEWDNLGIYWSFVPTGAQVYGGDVGNVVAIEARVKPKRVNWTDTIYLNLVASNEQEIRLLDNVPVTLVNPIRGQGYT